MANFAALRRAETASFASGEGRHVVVQHEAVFEITCQRIDALRIAVGAQRGHDQRLRFTAGK